jgi:hypothetical protein
LRNKNTQKQKTTTNVGFFASLLVLIRKYITMTKNNDPSNNHRMTAAKVPTLLLPSYDIGNDSSSNSSFDVDIWGVPNHRGRNRTYRVREVVETALEIAGSDCISTNIPKTDTEENKESSLQKQ